MQCPYNMNVGNSCFEKQKLETIGFKNLFRKTILMQYVQNIIFGK